MLLAALLRRLRCQGLSVPVFADSLESESLHASQMELNQLRHSGGTMQHFSYRLAWPELALDWLGFALCLEVLGYENWWATAVARSIRCPA